MFLLVDNSNSRTKFALATPEGLLPWRGIIPTPEISPESLDQLLAPLTFSHALIGSVVPEKAKILEAYLTTRAHTHQLRPHSPLPIAIHYPNPSQIGADRIANAAGAIARYPYPAIVIDFGTAVTFDVISHEPAWIGGVIAPGLSLMSQYLVEKTALLPPIELSEPTRAIGQSTSEAMLAGAIFGYRGMIQEILAKIQAELPSPATLIATGGDAALIAQGIPAIHIVDPHITLDGLRHIAVHLFSQSIEK